jgi:hypothetical protein
MRKTRRWRRPRLQRRIRRNAEVGITPIVPTSRLCRPREGTPVRQGRGAQDVGTIRGSFEQPRLDLGRICRQRLGQNRRKPWLALKTSARLSPVSPEKGSARAAGLCHLASANRCPSPRQRRHNRNVGTIGDLAGSVRARKATRDLQCASHRLPHHGGRQFRIPTNGRPQTRTQTRRCGTAPHDSLVCRAVGTLAGLERRERHFMETELGLLAADRWCRIPKLIPAGQGRGAANGHS